MRLRRGRELGAGCLREHVTRPTLAHLVTRLAWTDGLVLIATTSSVLLPRRLVRRVERKCESLLRARRSLAILPVQNKTKLSPIWISPRKFAYYSSPLSRFPFPSRLSPARSTLSQRDYNVTGHHLTTSRPPRIQSQVRAIFPTPDCCSYWRRTVASSWLASSSTQ